MPPDKVIDENKTKYIMKHFLPIFLALLLCLPVFSQNENVASVASIINHTQAVPSNTLLRGGTWHPITNKNVTVTDLNGDSYNVAQILNKGLFIFLDVSATYCYPCWMVHRSGVLEQIYDNHARGSNKQLLVFWAEGNPPGNDINAIYGKGSGTQGDWTNGQTIPYPIFINNQAISLIRNLGLAVKGFPSLYLISPRGYYIEMDNYYPYTYDHYYTNFIQPLIQAEQRAEQTYSVTIEPSVGGRIELLGANNPAKVKAGTTLTVNVIPEKGYKLVSLYANNMNITSNLAFTVQGNITLRATFAKNETKPKYKVTLITEGNGTAQLKGYDNPTNVPEGTVLTVIPTPATNSRVVSITANNNNITTNPTFTVSQNTTVRVVFAATMHTVTIEPTEHGHIELENISNPAQIEHGTNVRVKVYPDNGYKLVSLYANNTDVTSSLSFKIIENTTLVATFLKQTVGDYYAVTISKEGDGTVKLQGWNNLKAVPQGTVLRVNVTPTYHSKLLRITANNIDITAKRTFAVNEDVLLSVVFENKSFEVKVSPTTNGSVNITGSNNLAEVPYGTVLNVVATPNEGYELTQLTANKKNIFTTKSFTVMQPTTVTASFAPLKYAVTINHQGEGIAELRGWTNYNSVPYGTPLAVYVLPNSGYKLSGIFANQTNVTETKQFTVTQPTQVTVQFTKTTNAETPGLPRFTASLLGNTLSVLGTPDGSEIKVFSLKGEMLYCGYNTQITFATTPAKGALIVVVGTEILRL